MIDLVVFVGMVMVVLAQVSNMVVTKMALSTGSSKYVLIAYANALSTLILSPAPLFLRSVLPKFTISILSSIFLLAFFGFSGNTFAYAGIQYSSPMLGTAMLSLIPAITFLLAIIFRMEKLDWRRSSSQAKTIGTILSVGGAIVVTFYRGKVVLSPLSPHSRWILGGFLLFMQSLLTSLWYILQASILKKYPSIPMVVLTYCFFETLQSALFALAVEEDPSCWRLSPDMGLLAVVYTACIGTLFRISMTTLCLRRTGPLYVSMFKPLGIVMAVVLDSIFLGDRLHVGDLMGAMIIAVGFYTVIWGKSKEESTNTITANEAVACPEPSTVPLLKNDVVSAQEIVQHRA